ncbi:MAG: cytochrome o ubiquinol oxidase subunit III [Enterobacteriaceae bacterium PSmelAO3-2]|nr:cytochrome o ubiquinol oxidase subunit III [Enterobacteriaceae bacterium Cmel17]WMC17434.1 MAG: cytochrome o ubiquinol oxidase subunit III [Enterobacteriaceae bacterium Cmel21]WMC17640.1 MAG: cytochrome o ubiquinol oxidase subunit III [Enterobacteriaceae bacterium PSmelAO3-2]WMC17845.1 MAG: cytochrome o ubiquinol oxidase subunit III [Enterobacteriaceae bacterium PSmelAO3-1]WMC18048.1 MAG: cytochrome o ubiquinol oxidase subunit III [Enterobacteriaceae bacterium PSmelAO1]
MNTILNNKNTFLDHKSKDVNFNTILGFWIYIMSDCILFASLFATYMVLINTKINEPIFKEIFNLRNIFIETIILLLSAFSYGIAMSKINFKNIKCINNWLFVTFLLGGFFLILEFNELYNFIKINFGPNYNSYMSGFFSIIVTHGIHVFIGLVWILTIIINLNKYGLNSINKTRLICLSLFWHFLDIIWICVFTIIYLLGYMYK